MRTYVLTDQFRKLLADEQADSARAATLIKGCPIEVRAAADDGGYTADIVASTADRDRYGDRVLLKGWQLQHFKANPVILWSHEHGIPPVGRAVKLWKADGKLIKRVEFTPPDLNAFGAMIGEMVRKRFLNTASVGFRAIDWQPTKAAPGEDAEELQRIHPYALDFLKHELLESSIVTVPANPMAVAEARAAGIDTAPMADVASRMLDGEPSAWLPKAWYAQAYEASRERSVIVDLAPGATAPDDDDAASATEPTQEERDMSAQDKVAEARKRIAEAKTAAGELASELQAAIVEACADLETHLRDVAELSVDLAEGTLERLKAHVHRVTKAMPQPEPEPAPAEDTNKQSEPSAEDLAEALGQMEQRLQAAVEEAISKHSGRLD